MPLKSSNFYYRVLKGVEGEPRLELVHFDEINDALINELKSAILSCTQQENAGVMFRIAAGAAAKRVFEQKAYKSTGLTKEGYCRREFDRDPSTVRDYVIASDRYEDLGGIECPVQPTSVHQLDVLCDVKPEVRRDLWLEGAKKNEGKAPPAALLLEMATKKKILIETRSKPELPDLPCSTLEEAVEFASRFEAISASQKPAWRKMREFLLTLGAKPQSKTTRAPKPGKKPRKTKDVKGQTLMFEEIHVAKAQS